MALEYLTDEEKLDEVYKAVMTPPNARRFGKGGIKKRPANHYVKQVEIAIDQRGSLGWQVKDESIADPSKQWVDYEFEGIELTIINYQIVPKKVDEAKKVESDKKIAKLEQEIIALAGVPSLKEEKENDLTELLWEIENSNTYIYLIAIDRLNRYSIRMHPDNLFAISLFNQLRILTTQDQRKSNINDHRLYHAVKLWIEKRPSTKDSNKNIILSTVWTQGDKPVWVGEDEVMTKASWRPIWKDVVTCVGNYVRSIHNQPDLDAKKERAIAGKQNALPPSKESIAESLLEKLQSAANEAFNKPDLERLNRILTRVTSEKETIDRLGDLRQEAKEYVERLVKLLANPEVIDVESTPIDAEAIAADSPANPKPTDENSEDEGF